MDLGAYLHARRTELRMSLRDVEQLSGVSRTYISMLELGQHENMTVSRLVALAKALRIVPEDLFRVAAGAELSRGDLAASVAAMLCDLPPSDQEDMLAMIEAMARAKRQRHGPR